MIRFDKIAGLLLALAAGVYIARGDVSAFDSRIATGAAADAEGFVWIDGTKLPLESKGYRETLTPYGRLPADCADRVPSGLKAMQAHATGHYFILSTDSPEIVFAWTLAEKDGRDPFIPPQGMYGVDIYRYVPDAAAASVRSLTKGGWKFVKNGRVRKDQEDNLRVALPGEGMRGVLIYLPTRGCVKSCRLGIKPGSRVEGWHHPNGVSLPVVHYGTSIVHGGCASRPGLCFTSQAGRLADVPYVNLGFSGCAKLELEVADVVAAAPASLYIVDPVWNCDVNLIEARCEPFLRRLHERCPETPILLCEGIEPQDRKPENVALEKVWKRLAAENSSLSKKLHYLPANGLIPRDGESTHDYCHPNDYGSMSLGMAFAKKIREVLNISDAPLADRDGGVWKDDKGVHINAHGGCILAHDGRYWWYGEHKNFGRAGNRAHGVAVHVYSSVDLKNWHDEGAALRCEDDPSSDIADGSVIERPKVLHCAKIGKFVMRFHLEPKGAGYGAARTGIAVADRPEGPFRFLRGTRLNAGHWPTDVPESRRTMATVEKLAADGKPITGLSGGPNGRSRAMDVFARDYAEGQMTRDQTLFVDDDGKAYQISASEDNSTLQIAELTDDYLDTTGRYWRLAEKDWTEAPAVFKQDGWYYLIGSGCTGWAPNAARSYRARRLTGPWERLGNPCRGINLSNGLGPDKTWGGQSTFVFTPVGSNRPVAMFDLWRPQNAIDGRYVWREIGIKDNRPVLEW